MTELDPNFKYEDSLKRPISDIETKDFKNVVDRRKLIQT